MRIIVVGAGLIGLCSAHYLVTRGARVTIVDRQSAPGLETSYANAGMITPSQSEPWNEPGIVRKLIRWLGRDDAPVLLRPAAFAAMPAWGARFLLNSTAARFHANARANACLAVYSLHCLRELRRGESLDYGQICRGTVKIYRDRTALEEGMATSRLLALDGNEPALLDAPALTALEPQLGSVAARLVGGIHYPGDESGDAHRFCGALAASLLRRGVEIRTGIQAREFLLRGGVAHALDTSVGQLPADAFVLCAGSWSPGLAAGLRTALPVQPVKGYSITIDAPAGAMPGLPIVDDAMHIALTPMDGRLRVAGTAELSGSDITVRPERIRNLVHAVQRVLPRCAPPPGEDIRPWAGLRPYCCDGVPIIGPTRAANVFVNTGHGHLGWTMAAGAGRVLADLVTGVAPEIEAHAYRVLRF